MAAEDIIKRIADEEIQFVDLRFSDTLGKEQHVTLPAHTIDEEFFEEGKMFDGSSIVGWKGISESDMVLMPDTETAYVDPFSEFATLNLTCDILEPDTMQGYSRCPRSLAKRAEAFLQSSGLADEAYFGPEPEFFVFDDVRWKNDISGCSFEIDSEEAAWNTNKTYEDGNYGHRPRVKGGYFPVPPVDGLADLRSLMCATLEAIGIPVEVHHHEVGTAGQCEIGTRFNTLVRKADEMLMLKYVVHNVAHRQGQTATFMPKPLVGDNGSGMHVHQSFSKGGKNMFAGDGYGGLSETALHYIGGIFKHARAINAFANSTTNSYKRLVPGFEAPVLLAYSARNRSASCRVPWVGSDKARRIEIRFGDAAGNPYLTFAAMLMAGLDGVINKIDPGAPMDKDLYDLPPEEERDIPRVCHALDQALDALDKDRDFLKAGDVFTDDLIDGYIKLKMDEVTRFRMSTHPVEFDMYYSS
ncbi:MULTISPECIES: type I glutamate--ammonia ligase [unclassified Wenzhouxiangella]|uniref:type I glutamate--ammonia ligase n=1 Tax=unclassified Wenzhouxiangella TaxID=2613841 RepID=UPI000E3267A8|nr:MULTISPECIES: type I glutamate--ammonia ligase [unclassified Wenzhouxiangella]RFF27147.1 type I glutamate--ammonia ligase [Wenzhouxiangella sp. 15181]RFP69166.1 type I glutamate--ammonia ligase [Wenzhouxiangella sp. 15190]